MGIVCGKLPFMDSKDYKVDRMVRYDETRPNDYAKGRFAPKRPNPVLVPESRQQTNGSHQTSTPSSAAPSTLPENERALHHPNTATENERMLTQRQTDWHITPQAPFNWTLGKLIGAGAYGRVFMGLNNNTGEIIAVKQVPLAKDEHLKGEIASHIQTLEVEVTLLSRVSHENIVQYLGTECTDDALNIFLEYVPGGSIASVLEKFGPLPESVFRLYTKQILRGLEYLHKRQIMHRDIKGANILVDGRGTVKLADFGASKQIETLATIGSGEKSIKGTPYWMAPEVIQQVGHSMPADIWSLGCVVIEMATGRPPWGQCNTPLSVMFKIASSRDPPPLPDHLSPEAKDFILLCFNRVPKERPNATRLLKHPFVTTSVQAPIPRAPVSGHSSHFGQVNRQPISPIKEEHSNARPVPAPLPMKLGKEPPKQPLDRRTAFPVFRPPSNLPQPPRKDQETVQSAGSSGILRSEMKSPSRLQNAWNEEAGAVSSILVHKESQVGPLTSQLPLDVHGNRSRDSQVAASKPVASRRSGEAVEVQAKEPVSEVHQPIVKAAPEMKAESKIEIADPPRRQAEVKTAEESKAEDKAEFANHRLMALMHAVAEMERIQQSGMEQDASLPPMSTMNLTLNFNPMEEPSLPMGWVPPAELLSLTGMGKALEAIRESEASVDVARSDMQIPNARKSLALSSSAIYAVVSDVEVQPDQPSPGSSSAVINHDFDDAVHASYDDEDEPGDELDEADCERMLRASKHQQWEAEVMSELEESRQQTMMARASLMHTVQRYQQRYYQGYSAQDDDSIAE